MLSGIEKRVVSATARMYAKHRLTEPEAVRDLRRHVAVENLSEALAVLPPALATAVRESLARHPPLKAVGYWWSPEEAYLPDPRRLVTRGWRATDRPRIVTYLESGAIYAHWRGLSWCRFSWARCRRLCMGSRCMTDGHWVWPEGLPHYVQTHSVRLPDEFVDWMQGHDWRVPVTAAGPTRDSRGKADQSFWIAWGQAQGQAQG